jgi:integrase
VVPPENLKVKSDHPWVVPLSSLAVEIFEALTREAGGSGWVCASPVNPDVPIGVNALTQAMKRLYVRGSLKDGFTKNPKRADMGRPRPYDLRRTVRTGLAKMRIDPDVARRCLDHRPKGADVDDLHYNQHDYVDERRDALEAWATYLRRTITPPPSNVVEMRPVEKREVA